MNKIKTLKDFYDSGITNLLPCGFDIYDDVAIEAYNDMPLRLTHPAYGGRDLMNIELDAIGSDPEDACNMAVYIKMDDYRKKHGISEEYFIETLEEEFSKFEAASSYEDMKKIKHNKKYLQLFYTDEEIETQFKGKYEESDTDNSDQLTLKKFKEYLVNVDYTIVGIPKEWEYLVEDYKIDSIQDDNLIFLDFEDLFDKLLSWGIELRASFENFMITLYKVNDAIVPKSIEDLFLRGKVDPNIEEMISLIGSIRKTINEDTFEIEGTVLKK